MAFVPSGDTTERRLSPLPRETWTMNFLLHTRAIWPTLAKCLPPSGRPLAILSLLTLPLALFACNSFKPNNGPEPNGPVSPAASPSQADTATSGGSLHVSIDPSGIWLLLPLVEAQQFEPIFHDNSIEENVVLFDGVPVGLDTAWLTVEDALRKIKLVGDRMTTLAMPQSLVCSPPVRDAIAALNLPRLLVVLRRPGEQGEALTECFRRLGVGDLHVVLSRPTAGQIEAVSKVANVTELRLHDPQSGVEAIAALSTMPRLQTLGLSGVAITPTAWKGLLSLRFLKVLDLGNCRLKAPVTAKKPGRAAFEPPSSLPKLEALLASDVKGELAPLAELLPLLDADALIALELPGTPQVEDHGKVIERFTNLRSLRILYASTEPLTLDFSKLPLLTLLDLYGCKVLPELIPGIATLKQLKSLCLTGKRVGNDEARQLLAIRGLESLHLGETGITDALVPEIAEMPQLKALYLSRTDITDTAVKALSGNRLLRRLVLAETKISDNAGVYLGRMKGLVSLVLDKTSFGNIGAAFLDELPHLRFLHLDETQVSDNALSAFAKLPALDLLNLQGTKVTGQNLGALAAAKALRQLELSDTPLDPAALAAQPPLNGLESLRLKNTAVDAAAIKWAAALPRLLLLELGGPKLDVQSLEFLSRSSTLATLTLSKCDITADVLYALSLIHSLRHLSIPFSPQLTPEAFAPLAQLKDLVSLMLKGPATRPADMLQAIREFLPGVQVY